MPHPPLRLGVNVDHVATLRNARAGPNPDPVRAALLAIEAGADGITAHLREDRRHIRDDDMARLKAEISKPLNFEMAATSEMLEIALAPSAGLEVHAGHGLDYVTAEKIAGLPEIVELNIGYYMVGQALFVGLGETVRTMRAAMDRGRNNPVNPAGGPNRASKA